MKTVWLLLALILTGCTGPTLVAIPYCPLHESLNASNTPCVGWRASGQSFSAYPTNYVRTKLLNGEVPLQTLIIVTPNGEWTYWNLTN